LAEHPKDNQNISGGSDEQNEHRVKFPKRLRHRGQGRVLATIYKGDNPTQPYCLYWRVRVDGKRRSRFKSFATYSEAKKAGDKIVNDIARGALAATLSPGQVSDALAALERLREHYVATGRKVSLLGAVSDWAESSGKLNGRTLGDAVEGFLRTTATLKRKPLAEAVKDFVTSNQPRTVSHDGQRPEIDPAYATNRAKKLAKFVAMLPNHAVCDLSKTHLDAFMAALPKMKERPATSPKARNHYRGALKQFLGWAVRNDYLPSNHRLFDADSMRTEKTNGGDTGFYTPKEFRTLLEAADGPMRAILAIGGLAGLRTQEILRLDWADVWRVPRHIEVTSAKAKTRQRRLVEVCSALQAWLKPFRQHKTGKLWPENDNIFQKDFLNFCEQAGVTRKANGLRHAFCTFHFALHSNENLTAAQAGNSPGMIHGHYKGLATRKEALAWFAVKPAKSQDNIVQLQTKAAQ
jgi:integrase